MHLETLIYEQSEKVCIIKINGPEALNAINNQVFHDLFTVIEFVEKSKNVNVVSLTGQGQKSFAAGTDIKEMESLSCSEAREFAVLARKSVDRIGTETTRMGQPEINLGVIPESGGTQRLTRLIGGAKAAELFTGKIIVAQTALDSGLLNRIVAAADLLKEARAFASQFAEKSTLTLALMKSAINTGNDLDLKSALGIVQK